MSIQTRITSLRGESVDADWDGMPNLWLRNLNSRHLSDTAIRLVQSVVGGNRIASASVPFKLFAGERLIDVKVATMSRISNNAAFAWRNIKLQAPYTHLALVAIYPKDARLFIIPRDDLPRSALGEVKGADDNFQIVTTRAWDLPDWLECYELEGAP